MKSILLALLGMILTWGAWKLGYHLSNPESESQSFTGLVQKSPTPATSKKGFRILANVQNDPAGVPPALAKEVEPIHSESPYSSIISKNHLEKEYHAMAKVFPNTRTGDALRYIAVFYKFRAATATEEGQLVNELLDLLKAHSTESFNDLRQNISKMPHEYSTERQYFVELVSSLDVDRAAKKRFFTEELQRASGAFSSSDPASYNGMIAFRALLNETETPAELVPMLREVLAQQKDLGARSILLSTYERFAPAEAEELRSEFPSE